METRVCESGGSSEKNPMSCLLYYHPWVTTNLDVFYNHVTHHALDSEADVLFGPNFIFIARETQEKATRERNREKKKRHGRPKQLKSTSETHNPYHNYLSLNFQL